MNMLRNVNTINDLKNEAIKIKNKEKVIVYWPQFGKKQEQAFNLERDHCVSEHAYTVNKSVIAFYERGTLYVIPYFKKAMEILEQEEYVQADMYVPFSNQEYPVLEMKRWHELQNEIKEIEKKGFEAECLEFCQEVFKVEPISEELLKENCMLFPDTGMKISNSIKGEIQIYPEVTGNHLDCFVMDALTRYCIKGGIITFVNADGNQYITKKAEMLDKLMEAGYKFADIYVPFSNGEEPEEEDIIRKWNSL